MKEKEVVEESEEEEKGLENFVTDIYPDILTS